MEFSIRCFSYKYRVGVLLKHQIMNKTLTFYENQVHLSNRAISEVSDDYKRKMRKCQIVLTEK